jgi:hypothetical protein
VKTPGGLCDIVATIAQGAYAGELVVLEGETRRSIFFDAGNVVGATTNAPGERLGEVLWRFGAITRDQLEEIVRAAETSGKRVGEAAMDLEFVGEAELFHMMARQVEEVVYGAVQASHATFFLFDRFDDARVARRHPLSTSALLMEAARRMDELRFFRERVPSDAWVPVALAAASSRKTSPELLEVLVECDGRRSVAEIGRRVGQLEFEVTRAIFQLAAAGMVNVQPPRPVGPAAVVDAFNRALVEIYRVCDSVKVGRDLRSGVDRFASSTGVYVSLLDGAGPLADGSLRADRVARNAMHIDDDEGDAWLSQQLFEYTGFALFHAGTLLPRDAETSLNARVADMLKPLRQQPESGAPPSRTPPPSSSPAPRRGQLENR